MNEHSFTELGRRVPRVSEARLEARRTQILDAAVACFARKGFHQTTMAEIAAEAGVSDGLAYRYFASKEQLIDAAVQRQADPVPAAGVHAASRAETVTGLVRLLLDADVDRLDGSPEVTAQMAARFRTWAEAVHDADRRDAVLARWRHHIEVGAGLAAGGQAAGTIAHGLDPEAVGRVLLAVHDGLNLQAVLDPEMDLARCNDVVLALFAGAFGDDRAEDDRPVGAGQDES